MVAWRTPIHRELNRGLRDVLGQPTAERFAALGVDTVGDLVRHTPRRYLSGTQMSSFDGLRVGDDAAIVARVAGTRTVKAPKPSKDEPRSMPQRSRVETTLTDGGGTYLRATFFTTKPHIVDWWDGLLRPGARGIFVGRVGAFNGELQLTHPEFVMIDEQGRVTGKMNETRASMGRAVQRGTLVGMYPATSKLPTWVIAESVGLVLPAVAALGDTLPEWVVEAAGVLPFGRALTEVHEPVDVAHAEQGIARLRFDEAFGMQLAMASRRALTEATPAVPRPRRNDGLLAAFDARLPFALTKGQQAVGEQIFSDLTRAHPMQRLLQGEVGSGKTIVALRAMLAVVDSGGQAVLLAPTEVLAKQHFNTITGLLGDLGGGRRLGAHPDATDVVLLTATRSAAARRAALASIADGGAGIVIGTHALLSDPVEFADLGLVVVDEQHRFGVEQRAQLGAKSERKPHTLVMTATPIPRSVAMTIFGDLDSSELRELPGGRQPIQTVFVNTRTHPTWVERAWQRIREEVALGRQAFVVCPAITGKQTESPMQDGESLTAVAEMLPRLEAGPLAGLRLAMVHGRQPVAERDKAMADFNLGLIDVLVATTVIEVGVDVPNASVMVVMDADRFGISQLHQLRGRVGRGDKPGLCLLLAGPKDGAPAVERLEAVAANGDGFTLAERDLELRREGDVLGTAQSGESSLKLLRVLVDADLIREAKHLAERVLGDRRSADDPLLCDLMDEAELLATSEWLEKA